MTSILKGDTSGTLKIVLAEGYDYTGSTVHFDFCGIHRSFANVRGGDTLSFELTAEETAALPLGAFAVHVYFVKNGLITTVKDGGIRFRVTDNPDEVYIDGVIAVNAKGIMYGITDLPEHYTDKDVVAKLREVMRRGGAVLCALFALGTFAAFGASVQTAQKQDIFNDGTIVTNVDFSGLAKVDQLKDGTARMLPPYLHFLEFADPYADDAAWYYHQADVGGACSSVRNGNTFARNFDFPYDNRAEFVVRMVAGAGRFASVGVSNVGTNLTEEIVTSGKQSRFFKCLPGATVDGINENGVAVNINLVCTNGTERTAWHGNEINAIGAVRWVLDHATSAGMAASNLAAKVYIPDALISKGYSAHFMVVDEYQTWIVEDGVARDYTAKTKVLTNFRVFDMDTVDDPFGTGYERYDILASGGNITSAWFRAAYRRPFTRPTEFSAPGIGTHAETNALLAWADANIPQGAPETLTRNGRSWQTIHTSVYDISGRVLRVAVQERNDWFVFAIPTGGGSGGGGTPDDYGTVKAQAQTGSAHAAMTDNPHGVTAEQVGTYDKTTIDGKVANATPSDYATVKSKAEAAQNAQQVQAAISASGHQTAQQVQTAIANAGHVTTSELQPVSSTAQQAYAYASGIYTFMHANTNAWFEGTNYPDRVTAATKHKFAFEEGMDLLTMPCSMALFEMRDGERQCVWDQKDWTSWYWCFKSTQLSNTLASATADVAENVRTNYMRRGWAKYTAVNGITNPVPDTLWIDTPKITIAAGMQWQKMVETGGTAYYTIIGNGIDVAPEITEQGSFLTFKDFEGNAVLTLRKTSLQLVYCECGTDITGSAYLDDQQRITFHFTTDVQPTGEFTIDLHEDFIEETEDDCPATYEWTGTSGNFYCHFKAKASLNANACFARFKVKKEGENVVEYAIPVKINGGIIFEQSGQAVKAKPVAAALTKGSTVNWIVD